ncbi:MAG: hypothetical protein RJA48_823 [Verrucomicrobiota bacterium]
MLVPDVHATSLKPLSCLYGTFFVRVLIQKTLVESRCCRILARSINLQRVHRNHLRCPIDSHCILSHPLSYFAAACTAIVDIGGRRHDVRRSIRRLFPRSGIRKRIGRIVENGLVHVARTVAWGLSIWCWVDLTMRCRASWTAHTFGFSPNTRRCCWCKRRR